jgi:hypothetical protein
MLSAQYLGNHESELAITKNGNLIRSFFTIIYQSLLWNPTSGGQRLRKDGHFVRDVVWNGV